MKNFIIVMVLCFTVGKTVAQEQKATISFALEKPDWSKLLSRLDTLKISSGVLYDKVTPFADLLNFNNGQGYSISSSDHFTQAMSELYYASNKKHFLSVEELNERIKNNSEITVNIGIINTSAQILNFNEDEPDKGGLIIKDSIYTPIDQRIQFIDRKVVVISPLVEMIVGDKITFVFNNDLMFTNETSKIKTMSVDFDDKNQDLNIINNSEIIANSVTVNYSETGMKTLTFKITFEDDSTITTYGRIYVFIPLPQNNPQSELCYELLRERGTYISPESFQGYSESTGVFGKIEYTVFYHNNNGNTQRIMSKPLIIVDGFDPRDKRKVQDCDCENDITPAPNNCRFNNSDITFNFSTSPMVSVTFNPAKHESIVDTMDYFDAAIDPVTGQPGKANFMEDLRNRGYDVIIINNPTYTTVNTAGQTVVVDGGADYIERNAITLASFMKNYVKNRQNQAGSSEPLVLIGPSMGGQITRYTLAYMEKKFAETSDVAWKHNARLWVSVDSPHLGANIPVGAQANIWFLSAPTGLGNIEAQKSYDDLNSVAGKQQSILNFEYARTSANHNLQGSPFFNTYYNNLALNGVTGSNGYPVSIPGTFRKIAMTNGSLTGKKQGVESQTFLYTRIYIRGLWPFQSSTITLARFQDIYLPKTGVNDYVFKGDGQNFNIGFNHWSINHKRYTVKVNNQDVRGSLDVVPGGYFKISKVLKESLEEGARDGGYRSETTDYIESSSFIASF